ncbi:hypothetical protein ACIRCZ_19430 [Leifsonia sp. NPDC102414]|uniref:hypothetical protein n=1 Tax=Leifsonia sp. NPDC102414 TaxID=3364124 RepID=UPI0037F1D4E7
MITTKLPTRLTVTTTGVSITDSTQRIHKLRERATELTAARVLGYASYATTRIPGARPGTFTIEDQLKRRSPATPATGDLKDAG